MERRRFLILDNPIQGEDIRKLLGRLTLNVKQPLNTFETADPSPITTPFLQPPIRENATSTCASAKQDRKLRSALQPFLKIANGASTITVETHRLRDPNKVFQRLVDELPQQIGKMMSYETTKSITAPRKLYMVVGYKSMLYPRRCGSTVFAVEYKMYERSTVLSFLRRKQLPWGYNFDRLSRMVVEDGEASGGSEEEESGESGEEESMDEELADGGYICRVGLDEFYVPLRNRR